MAFESRVFQLLIASPSDVADERSVITDLVEEWNYANSRERGVVILPLAWETHTSPEMGAPPQTIINRQIVDECDLVVGVFWNRLGTLGLIRFDGQVACVDYAA
jgi:hypothetical protein